MSALLKNLRVHFYDEVNSESGTKQIMDDERNGSVRSVLNYSRDQLLEFGRSKAAKEPPKLFNLSGADDKRKDKLRHILKNSDILKSLNTNKNGASDGTFVSKGGVTENDANNEQARTNFQQMISAAVSNAQQQNMEYAANNRRRIGSGRIVDSTRENLFPIGMDARYMRNKLFKEDGKSVKGWKSAFDQHWNNNSETVKHAAEIDNTDAKSDEPEWANCGPISKHDIIELHGFDGPEDDETEKSESTSVSPPARSTPSKGGSNKKPVKTDDHFNFEDFLKLDLPPSVNCSRDFSTGESRFSQWFGRDKLAHPNKFAGNAYETKTTQQLFDYHQKVNQKKMNGPNKVRSVNELEANWCPGQAKPTQPKSPVPTDVDAIRMMLNQLAASTAYQKQRTMNTAQSSFLLGLINKGAENLYQYRLTQNAIMKRPDAQLLLHRLINGEITQFHILQQIGNPTLHQRDRETLLAVFAFCNENQQWLLQQQEQQLKHKEQMSQQFRQLQMQLKSGHLHPQPPAAPTPQELQIHTQAIMQNAMYKKQLEDQYRNLQNLKQGNQTKFQSYKANNFNNNNNNNQHYNRFNNNQHYKQKQTAGQNGLQFIQSQNKASWNRHNPPQMSGIRNTNELFSATMPTFAHFDSTVMPRPNDNVPIQVEK